MTPLLEQAAETIKMRVNDIIFKIDARQYPTDFSRQGKLGFVNVIMMSLNYCSKTLQAEIEDFYEHIGKPECTVTRAGYLDARSKLKPEAFSMLLDDTTELAAGNHVLLKTINGYRFYAIDGSTLILEDTIALRGEFGVSGGGDGVASARLSTMTDVINSGIIMDVQLTKYSIGERESALKHHEKLVELGIEDNSVILYDRGYCSEQMVSDLNEKKIHYVFRLKRGWNKTIDELEVNTDTILHITPKGVPLTVRVVKFALDSGEIETLLIDPKLPADIFTFERMKDIYFLRWGIETNYRVLKSELKIECFTGTSSLFIKQDVYATAVALNLAAFAKLQSDEIIHERTAQKKNKYQQKTNENMLIYFMKNNLIMAMLQDCPEKSKYYIDKIIQSASKHTVPIRPGRSYPRTVKHRSRHPNNRKCAL